VQAEPETLIGKTLVANALTRTCYSPEWHKSPDSYNRARIIDHDSENEVLVLTDQVVIGNVASYGAGGYTIECENMETGEVTERTIHDFLMTSMLKDERWFVE